MSQRPKILRWDAHEGCIRLAGDDPLNDWWWWAFLSGVMDSVNAKAAKALRQAAPARPAARKPHRAGR